MLHRFPSVLVHLLSQSFLDQLLETDDGDLSQLFIDAAAESTSLSP